MLGMFQFEKDDSFHLKTVASHLKLYLVLYVSFSFVLKTRSDCLRACDNFLG